MPKQLLRMAYLFVDLTDLSNAEDEFTFLKMVLCTPWVFHLRSILVKNIYHGPSLLRGGFVHKMDKEILLFSHDKRIRQSLCQLISFVVFQFPGKQNKTPNPGNNHFTDSTDAVHQVGDGLQLRSSYSTSL